MSVIPDRDLIKGLQGRGVQQWGDATQSPANGRTHQRSSGAVVARGMAKLENTSTQLFRTRSPPDLPPVFKNALRFARKLCGTCA